MSDLRAENRWHALSPIDTLHLLKTNIDTGLTPSEVEKRTQIFGRNSLPVSPGKPWWKEILEEVTEPMILLLLAVGAVYGFLGELRDAIVIFVIIFAVLAIEIGNETKAKKAIKALARYNPISTPVIRNGVYQEIPTAELVPGDIVIMRSGQRIPADLRLLETISLRIDESSLTGESVSAQKQAGVILREETELGDRRNLAFFGTLVTNGKGKGVVINTGAETEVGKIVGLVKETREPRTPLQHHMRELTQWMVWVALGFSGFIAVLGWIRGVDWRETILTGLSLAFATIPEELPILIAMVIGLGAYRLSKQRVILRRLRTAETLGNVTIIATDKTGTLTENRMKLDQKFINGEWMNENGQNKSLWIELAAKIGVLANDANETKSEDGKRIFEGDPTDTAFLYEAERLGFDVSAIRNEYQVLEEFPLEDRYKRITVVAEENGKGMTFSKGAPEQLLALSDRVVWNDHVVSMTEEYRSQIEQMVNKLASDGYRVIAIAYKEEPIMLEPANRVQLETNLVFLGFCALFDPPRSDAAKTINDLRQAGIRVLMVTGDHPETARTIGVQVGLHTHKVLVGREIENMSDEQLRETVRNVSVFARTTPEHKLRIVRALQEQGEMVAVTGDGVNDGPALKEAAVGIAMGKTGTDVAKESADMLLADDRFSTLTLAVREGRKLFENLQKAVRYYLAAKIALISSTFFAALVGLTVPFAPIQIIVLELFMDLGAASSFTAESAENDVMKRHPRRTNQPFMDKNMLTGIFAGGLTLSVAVLTAYIWSLQTNANVGHAQTIAFATWMIGHLVLALVMRSVREPIFRLGVFSNKTMWIWILAAIVFLVSVFTIPGLRQILHLTTMNIQEWVLVTVCALLAPMWIEINKWVQWKKQLHS